MNKMLIEYIREESQCNYRDIYDYFKDLNDCADELKSRYLTDLIWYIYHKEMKEDNCKYLIKQAEKMEKIQKLSEVDNMSLAEFALEVLKIIGDKELEKRNSRT